MNRVVFPGSFNPFTIGHKAIVDIASNIFDEVIILFSNNSDKTLTSLTEFDKVSKYYQLQNEIRVISINRLVVDFCKDQNIRFIIKGIRNNTDYEYENNLAKINHELNHDIQTILIPTDNFISSSFVRELQKYGKDVTKYILN